MASLLASASFGTFVTSLFNFLNYFVWLRITDEGFVPEMRIWSILLMESDLKWCIHLDLFLYFNHFTPLVSIPAGGIPVAKGGGGGGSRDSDDPLLENQQAQLNSAF